MDSNVPYAMDHDEAGTYHVKPKILLKEDGMGSAKQISVDPISLRESTNQPKTVKYPPSTCPTINLMIPLVPRGRKNVVSHSLLNSVSSTPRVVPKTHNKRDKKHFHSVSSAIHRQDSIALANLDRLREIHLQRSKSCGEGRTSTPPEDFDLWVANKPDNVQNTGNNDKKFGKGVDNNVGKEDNGTDATEGKFKCKAMCLHLPAFGKVKSIRARRQSSDVSQAKESVRVTGHVVSKRVSLEMFECASVDSSGLINDDDEDTAHLFFDLPLELIKCSINDTHSPVTTGFVFDKEPKGVLKNSASKSTGQTKTTDSSVRHVRFSTSSQTSCVTPEMRNAREDFTAFIEAQSA